MELSGFEKVVLSFDANIKGGASESTAYTATDKCDDWITAYYDDYGNEIGRCTRYSSFECAPPHPGSSHGQ